MLYLKKIIIFIPMLFFVSAVYALNYDLVKLVKDAANGDPKSQKLLRDLNKPDLDNELKKVFDYFLSIAEKEENSIAQNAVGYMYDKDIGVMEDSKEALKWFLLAAKQGNPNAQYYTAEIYHYGKGGIEQDYQEALKWFLLSAKQNNPMGQLYVGFMHQYGLGGVDKNIEEALKWYKLSAKQNNPYGQFGVGDIYLEKKDYKKALKWFELAHKGAPESNAKQKIQEIYDIQKKLETESFEN